MRLLLALGDAGVLRNGVWILDMATKSQIFQQSLDANKRFLMDRTVTLFDYKKGFANGTGTLFKIANRVLIATAAHVIVGNPNGRLWPATEKTRHESEGFPAYASFARHPTLDVGYLEVSPEGAENYFGDRVFANIADIAVVGTGRENKSVIVVGAPAEHIDVQKHDNRTGSIGAKVLFYWTVPPLVADWPDVSTDLLDVNNDFVVEYPTDDQMAAEGFPPINLPHPGGISGGGIWDQGFDVGAVWTPHSTKLVAIQSSWYPKSRHLRAIQIHHWLRMLYRDFHDLRDSIEATHGSGPWQIT